MSNPLAAATAEDLERWANMAEHRAACWVDDNKHPAPDWMTGLAALARAVAKAERETDFEIEKAGGNVFVGVPARGMFDKYFNSFPAALAALLEDDQ
jgi:hypothetical protein